MSNPNDLLQIHISGSGTQEEIYQALIELADDIKSRKTQELLNGVDLEDATLMTEIEEI